MAWLKKLFGQEKRQAPVVPDGQRLYAIGDIHGRDDLLTRLLDDIDTDLASADGRQPQLVFLGDYVDRGPGSRQVVEKLLSLRELGVDTVFLRGNHDQAVLDFLQDPNFYRAWRGFGAASTLLSYGVQPPRFDDDDAFLEARNALAETIPRQHLSFFEDLQYLHIVGDYAFAHAGVRPGRPLDQQDEQDLLWIRDEFLASPQWFGKMIVHGHTPLDEPMRRSNRISIDTGAYATGRLTAAVLEGSSCRFLST